MDNRELDSKALDDLMKHLHETRPQDVSRILHGLIRHSILYPMPIDSVIKTALKTLTK